MYSPNTPSPSRRFSAFSRTGERRSFLPLLALAAACAFAAPASAQSPATAPADANTTTSSSTLPNSSDQKNAPSSTLPPPTPVLNIDAGNIGVHVSPTLYGFMTEEINFSYDGGLYGELLRNRTFQDSANDTAHWTLVQPAGGNGSIALDTTQFLNPNLPVSLRLDIASANATAPVGFSNDGFWGLAVHPNTPYIASFYAKAAGNFTGPLTVSLVSADGNTTFATGSVPSLSGDWKQYTVTLTTGNLTPTKDAVFQITAASPGTAWFSLVSLFPPTFNNRPNGNRVDLMQLLDAYHPAFLRFPGGNYLEGNTIDQRFNWKNTLGDLSSRPGHPNDAWRYRSSDGMGLLEFLEWCEDLKMQPVLAVYAGYSLRGQRVAPGPDLEPYVQDALDEIEYVTGNTSTKWGARRAQDGHEKPFPLTYVEIGNEDFFDRAGGGTYNARFAQFFEAIKAKYPNLQLIATTPVKGTVPDVLDNHMYTNSAEESEYRSTDYDKTSRTGPKVFEGEWATRVGAPTPNLTGAIGDAAYMTGLERNSDIVVMASYAPLFVNVSNVRRGNNSSMQWPTDLIGYNALTVYGSPAYYAQQMFNLQRGDVTLPISGDNIPTKTWQAPARRGRNGTPGTPPPPHTIPTLFYSATRDTSSGALYLKLVNTTEAPQPVQINISGAKSIAATGQSTVLTSANADDTNTIAEPTKVVPVTTPVTGLGSSFPQTLPPHSITILKLQSS